MCLCKLRRKICSNCSIFHSRLRFWRETFQKNSYPGNFIDRCFKLSLKSTHIFTGKVPTVEKKPLRIILPYFATISLQTTTKMQKFIKGVLNCCKFQVVFKNQNKLCNNCCFRDLVRQILTSGVVYKFQRGLCNESCYIEYVWHLAVRIGKHIAISPLTNRRKQRRIDCAVYHHLLNCNYLATFECVSVLCHKNKKTLLELKRTLIIRERPSINRNIRSTPLYLFIWVFVTIFGGLCELLWSVFS